MRRTSRLSEQLRGLNLPRLGNCFAIAQVNQAGHTPEQIAYDCIDFDKNMFFAYFEFDYAELPVQTMGPFGQVQTEIKLLKQVPLHRRYGIPLFHSIFLTHIEYDTVQLNIEMLKRQ